MGHTCHSQCKIYNKVLNRFESWVTDFIPQVLLEAGQDFITIKEIEGEDGEPDLLFSMDRSKIESVGKPAMAAFLQKLQVYKSTGDFEAAKAMYEHYGNVTDTGKYPFKKWRNIVQARQTARTIYVQANTKIVGKGKSKTFIKYRLLLLAIVKFDF